LTKPALNQPWWHSQRTLLRRATQFGVPLILLFLTRESWLAAIGRWLAYPPDQRRAEAIVVLGGREERADHAIDLYRQGLAPELWITGDKPPPRDLTSFASRMRSRAIAAGVPPSAIQVLRSESTWEDGRAIAALAGAREVDSLLVVTSWTHSRRAMCVIQHQIPAGAVQVSYDSPPNPGHGPEWWWQSPDARNQVLMELIKLGGYALRYGLNFAACR
jgi:uncharacterized SAM-binding protein YcdF (DUF218 family)